jgi:hypothetical protein
LPLDRSRCGGISDFWLARQRRMKTTVAEVLLNTKAA